jgi:hypothetical protein
MASAVLLTSPSQLHFSTHASPLLALWHHLADHTRGRCCQNMSGDVCCTAECPLRLCLVESSSGARLRRITTGAHMQNCVSPPVQRSALLHSLRLHYIFDVALHF